MIRRLLGACIGVAVVAAWACGGSNDSPAGTADDDIVQPPEDGGGDAGDEDAGTDAGTDAGDAPDSGTDAGTDAGSDAGTDGGTTLPPEGPWPTDAVTNYSSKYGIPRVQSVSVDGAHNIWVLDGDRIGVLRAGTTSVLWTSHPVGQAGNGRASGSTVICGGKAGEAYVGYRTDDVVPGGPSSRIASRGEPDFSEARYAEFLRGDMDVVRIDDTGTDVVLREHLSQSAGTSRPGGGERLGIQNTNDFHYDEDRSVFSCVRVMRGPYEGEVYIGTNHGVTRIRGYTYNSHRHPKWDLVTTDPTTGRDKRTQQMGYTYGLGISPEGHLLIANEWKIGIIPPNESLEWWDSESREPDMPADVEPALYALNTFVDPVNPGADDARHDKAPFNLWRGFQQTQDGHFYVASLQDGLWQFEGRKRQGTPLKYDDVNYVKVEGAGTDAYTALAATDDGSLFVGTVNRGLWRLTPDKQMEKVAGVGGSKVGQLVYDPRVTPSALYVLVDGKVFVLRGY
ncbi:hypothetical protein LZ198_38560 [Myxococcus sp. K15C18031901]|uniref:hypothetical protein n=1 Tax=Myxococcus dinghuensis TaxID=2906761 RepID=UPI0020A78922|nr:hypothetical protein [Myxococcus dinghuensis]MCP3104784.1 hypothetical protein [Myxococcus dinghuensis]